MSDEKGNTDSLLSIQGNNMKEVENFMRKFAIEHGLFVGVSFIPLTK